MVTCASQITVCWNKYPYNTQMAHYFKGKAMLYIVLLDGSHFVAVSKNFVNNFIQSTQIYEGSI